MLFTLKTHLSKTRFCEQSKELEETESKDGLGDNRVESRERFRDKGIFESFAMAEVVTICENVETECSPPPLLLTIETGYLVCTEALPFMVKQCALMESESEEGKIRECR